MRKKDEIEMPEIDTIDTKDTLDTLDTLEIQGDDIYIKIPNNLAVVSRAKRILEVYEEELIKAEKKEEPETADIEENLPQPIARQITEIDIEPPDLPQKQEVIEEHKQVEVKPFGESYTNCPLCNGKLKRKRLKKEGNILKQKVKCKNRRCNFEREYVFSI